MSFHSKVFSFVLIIYIPHCFEIKLYELELVKDLIQVPTEFLILLALKKKKNQNCK